MSDELEAFGNERFPAKPIETEDEAVISVEVEAVNLDKEVEILEEESVDETVEDTIQAPKEIDETFDVDVLGEENRTLFGVDRAEIDGMDEDFIDLKDVQIHDKGIKIKHPTKLAKSYPPIPIVLSTNMSSWVKLLKTDPTKVENKEKNITLEDRRKQGSILEDAISDTLLKDEYLHDVGRTEGSEWRQGLLFNEDKLISNVTPKFTLPPKGSDINDNRFSEMMARKVGMGSKIRVPLWNSGVWVTLQTPTTGQFIDFEKMISEDKVTVGRSTKGFLFSTDTSFHESRVADFCLSMVTDTNYQGGIEKLKDVILLPDLHLLAWNILCVRFPDGHPYEQVCSADMDNCAHVVSEVVDLSKCIWVDNSKFTESQRKHMAKLKGTITDADIEKYRSEFKVPSSERKILSNGIFIDYSIPNLNVLTEQALGWISSLEAGITNTFGQQISSSQKISLLENKYRACAIGLYNHWFSRLGEVNEDGEVLYSTADKDVIGETLVKLSGEEDIAREIIEGALKYISDVTTFIVGIPNYACPNCGKWHNTNTPSQYIVKLDILNLFFILYRNVIKRALAVYDTQNQPDTSATGALVSRQADSTQMS